MGQCVTISVGTGSVTPASTGTSISSNVGGTEEEEDEEEETEECGCIDPNWIPCI